MVTAHLTRGGYAVDAVAGMAAGLAALRCGTTYHAVLLDLGLPDGDGIQLLRRLRQTPETAPPVLILTARDRQESRVAGLDSGADDYLVKPFSLEELDARLRAILRRPGVRASAALALCNLVFDSVSRQAQVERVTLKLTRRETALLEALLRGGQRILVREALEESLYAADEAVTPNALEACMSRLRRKLMTGGANCRLDTHRGIGYALVAG